MGSESIITRLKDIFAKLSDFDIDAFLPELDTVVGKLELAVRLAVIVGPLIMLALGLWYFFLPPKEANHSAGYRTYFGMGSVEAWRFTQKIAGIVWGGLGLLLTVIMGIISLTYRGMEAMAMVSSAGRCLIWQMVLALISVIGIEITVLLRYDKNGSRRK